MLPSDKHQRWHDAFPGNLVKPATILLQGNARAEDRIPEGSCGMAFEADRRLMYGLAKLDVAFPKWKNLQEQSFIFRELKVNTRKDSL